jgi:tetratricopeptide (TPR) repeat protein
MSALLIGLHLSFVQWLDPATRPRSRTTSIRSSDFKALLRTADAQIKRSLARAPNDPLALSTLGILLDTKGKHYAARDAFRRSGQAGLGPFWHLLAATSWSMEDQHDTALRELDAAESEAGAPLGWLHHFYRGRAHNACGRHTEALSHLRKAYTMRGARPELLRDLAHASYRTARPGRSAFYRLLLALQFLTHQEWRRGLDNLQLALVHVSFALLFSASKVVWILTRRLPVLSSLHRRILSPNEFECAMAGSLFKERHFAEAQGLLERAVAIDSGDLDTKTLLAMSLVNQGRGDEAEAMLAALAVERPTDSAVHTNASTLRIAIRNRERLRKRY